jgi:hypothetical protein
LFFSFLVWFGFLTLLGASDAMKMLTKKEGKKWQKIQTFCSPIGNFRELRAIHDNRFELKIVSPSMLEDRLIGLVLL